MSNKLAIAAVVVVVLAGLGFVSFGNLSDNLVYYWTPSELVNKASKVTGQTVRLGGVVKKGSVKWDERALKLEFRVADTDKDDSPSVLVDSQGAPPQMFREGIGVVVEGQVDASMVFRSDRVLVNHSNEYRPPAEGQKPEAGYGEGTLQAAKK